jgi:predicted PurR-regulated permease PerM
MTRKEEMSDAALFGRTLVVMAAVGLALVLWMLTDLVLLMFACALVALMLFQFAQILQRRLHLPFALALLLAVVLPIVGILLIGWGFGSLMATQFSQLFDRLPAAFDAAQGWLRSSTIGREVLARYESFLPDGSRVMAMVQIVASNVGTAVTELVVVLVAGVYIAAQPRLYGRGMLALLPERARPRTVHVLQSIVHSINAWLKGQGIGMLFVGVGTAIGLWLVGLPSPLAIGMVAGLCEFVPYLGIIVVTIPAAILGFSINLETGIWTLVALLIVQQVQGNVVSPMAQKAMVDLPPALTIFSLIAAGVLLGPLGVILAVPLTVVGLVVVKELWARPVGRAEEEAVLPAVD